MLTEVVERRTHIKESIGGTVGKSALNKQGHTDEQGQHIPLTGKGDGSSHDESATYGQQSAPEGTERQAPCQYLLRRTLQVHRRTVGQHRHKKTADQVAREHECQIGQFVLLDKSCGTSIEFQFIPYDGEQGKGKEHAAHDVAQGQEAKASDTYGYTREYGRFEIFYVDHI